MRDDYIAKLCILILCGMGGIYAVALFCVLELGYRP